MFFLSGHAAVHQAVGHRQQQAHRHKFHVGADGRWVAIRFGTSEWVAVTAEWPPGWQAAQTCPGC